MKLFKTRTLRKGELRNVEVELVSLLFDDMTPANQKGAVIKSADGRSFQPRASGTKFKAETVGSQGRLYVTLMEPGVVDAQGDSYTAEEISKAADHFALKGLVGRNDVNHSMKPVPEFAVVESYILKTEDREHFPDTKIGAWVQVIKCLDLNSEFWQKVQKGQFHGVSIYGRADDAAATESSAAVEELKALRKTLETALASNPDASLKDAVANVDSRIAAIEKASGDAATNALITTLANEIKELTVTLTKAISKTLKGEPDQNLAQDQTVTIAGEKILVKASKIDLYKGIANVDAGSPMNILNPATTSLFIDEVIGSSPGDTLSDISVLPLMKDETIDAGLIDDIVLKNALDGAVTAQDISSASIACTTGILSGEMTLGRDIVEFYKDKYGEAAFGAYVENHIARKVEKALRLLLFKGDRASGTPKLAGLNGLIKLATTGVAVTDIDDELYPTWVERFTYALTQFDDEKLEDQANFVIYVSFKDLIRIKAELAQRETNEGDRLLLTGGNVSFDGIPVKGRLLTDNYIIAGLPKFIIIGYRTDAELKVEHHGSDWKYHWYVRVRPGITYVDGFVKVFLVG